MSKMLLSFVLFLLIHFQAFGEEGFAFYLTWTKDPSHTIRIQWITKENVRGENIVYYREGGAEQAEWVQVKGLQEGVVGEEDSSLFIYGVELEALRADETYEFQIGGRRVYSFRTLPKNLKRPVRFVVGGDAYFSSRSFEETNREIVKKGPDFVVIGGDIAYAEGQANFFRRKHWNLRRWQTFFEKWSNGMVTEEGRVLPFLVVVGNHDVRKSSSQGKEELFYAFFPFLYQNIAYRVLDLGDYLSLFLLDSGHSAPISGIQTEWLQEVLQERENIPYKMAIYHVAAYPSVYPYESRSAAKIRTYWVPLFEKYGIQIALEHHNHAYKRTYPLKEGKIDPSGVIYLGDGAWGVPKRKPSKRWYLAKTAQKNCFWNIDVYEDRCVLEPFGQEGERIDDEVEIYP